MSLPAIRMAIKENMGGKGGGPPYVSACPPMVKLGMYLCVGGGSSPNSSPNGPLWGVGVGVVEGVHPYPPTQVVHTDSHPKLTLEEHTRQPGTIIKTMSTIGMTNHKVLDIMHSITGNNDTSSKRVHALKLHTHTYNVHLTPTWYVKLAATIITTTESMMERPSFLPGQAKRVENTSWHRFTTTSGYGTTSRVALNVTSSYKR